MKDLFIYHPGTGTLISLSDPVYLVDAAEVDDEVFEYMSDGLSVDIQFHKGYRLDNYNMTNLFFEGE
jgi:hypothetical protein